MKCILCVRPVAQPIFTSKQIFRLESDSNHRNEKLDFLFFTILKYITSIYHRAFRLLHSLQWIQGLTKVIHAMSDTTAYYSQIHTRQNQWQELLYHMQSFINRSVTRKPHHVDAWKIWFLSLQKNMDQMMMCIALCLCNCLHSPRGREMRNFLTMWRPLQMKDLLWQDLWFESNSSRLTWDLNSPQKTPKRHRPNSAQSQGWGGGGVSFWLRGDTYWIIIPTVGSDTMLKKNNWEYQETWHGLYGCCWQHVIACMDWGQMFKD